MHEFAALLQRDSALMWQKRADAAQPMLFALMVCVMFPLALGSEPTRLAQIAGAVIWVAHLLASLLVLDNLYRSDFEDGSLEQLLLAPVPLPLVIASKVSVHWLSTALPVLLITPLLAQMLFLPDGLLPVLMLSLLLGSLLMSLIGAMVAALEASEPVVPPCAAPVYHNMTYGYLVGELVRRVSGEPPASRAIRTG